MKKLNGHKTIGNRHVSGKAANTYVVGKIEKGIAPPESMLRQKGNSKYPVLDMKPGDSFAIKAKTPDQRKKAQSNVMTTVYLFKKNKQIPKSWQFASRSNKDEVRVWRLK